MKWIIAGTLLGQPYPCRCHELSPWDTSQCGSRYCACWGRLDTQNVPADCCARRKVWESAGAALLPTS
jgi:hypothetical protein